MVNTVPLGKLRVHRLGSVREKTQWLKDFNPETTTWLVSDLKSKHELQNQLLQRFALLPETSVLRASELWRKLLQRACPEFDLVSMDLVRALLSEWLRSEQISWARGSAAGETLISAVGQFVPLFVHNEGESLLEGWLDEHPESRLRWQHWFEVARRFWLELKARRWLPQSWASSALLDQPDLGSWWKKSLISDLGGQMTLVETELLRSYARTHAVDVLAPGPSWLKDYGEIASLYARLEPNDTGVEHAVMSNPTNNWSPKIEFRRATTILGEIKSATAQCRSWLESGAKLSSIAIVAPNIEQYWPSLSTYLEEEGIPVTKPSVVRLHSIRSVQLWRAWLKIKSGQIQATDLELCESGRDFEGSDFRRFYRLFSALYDGRDLGREQRIERIYRQDRESGDIISFYEFMIWAIKYWPGESLPTDLERALLRLLQETPSSLRLKVSSWRDVLFSRLSSVELVIKEASPHGVHVVNVNSLEWIAPTHIYYLGFTQQGLREPNRLPLTLADVRSIEVDLGFTLPHPEQLQLEFETRWLLESSDSTTVLSNAATDTAGDVLSPHPLWLVWQAERGVNVLKRLETFDLDTSNRWDRLQSSSWDRIIANRNLPEEHAELLELSLKIDMGASPQELWRASKVPRLSASRLESFARCPFTGGASYLGLVDDSPLDMDLDPSVIGRWQHAIVTEIALSLDDKQRPHTDEELSEIILRAKINLEVIIGDQYLDDVWFKRMLRLAREFESFERSWRVEHPGWKPLRPHKINGIWSLDDASLKMINDQAGQSTPRILDFTGEIDRIDLGPHDELVVIDYKKSATQNTNLSSWLKADRFQLGLYAMALSEGLTELGSKNEEVVGAFYYSLSPLKRERGFWLPLRDGERLASEKCRIEVDTYREFQIQLKARVQAIAQDMLQGSFPARPRESKICDRCAWRRVCRLPKFN